MIEIADHNICCGCEACVNICPQQCITMQPDPNEFLYPVIDPNKCIECGLCRHCCPVLQKSAHRTEPIETYAAMNTDENIRMNSSSGGVFSVFADEILSHGGVVIGAAFSEDFRHVEHIAVESAEEMDNLRGSKYVQSRIGFSYKQAKDALELGRWVLFSGTPCQIEGLRSFLRKDYEKLLCVDIICHGVPSPKIWSKYIDFREQEAKAKTTQICFRKKDKHGWESYDVFFSFENGSIYERNHLEDLYIKAFVSDICLRDSCYNCKFKGISRCSDITIADFWGIKETCAELYDDKGVSLVFVHSEKGYRFFNKENGSKLSIRSVDIEDAIRHNFAAVQSVPMHRNRELFFNSVEKMTIDKLVSKYAVSPLSFRSILVGILRRIKLLDIIKSMYKK